MNIDIKISLNDLLKIVGEIKSLKKEVEILKTTLSANVDLVSENTMLKATVEAYEDVLKKHNINEGVR